MKLTAFPIPTKINQKELSVDYEKELLKIEEDNSIIPITSLDRISALESAIADLAILLANNENIKEE